MFAKKNVTIGAPKGMSGRTYQVSDLNPSRIENEFKNSGHFDLPLDQTICESITSIIGVPVSFSKCFSINEYGGFYAKLELERSGEIDQNKAVLIDLIAKMNSKLVRTDSSNKKLKSGQAKYYATFKCICRGDNVRAPQSSSSTTLRMLGVTEEELTMMSGRRMWRMMESHDPLAVTAFVLNGVDLTNQNEQVMVLNKFKTREGPPPSVRTILLKGKINQNRTTVVGGQKLPGIGASELITTQGIGLDTMIFLRGADQDPTTTEMTRDDNRLFGDESCSDFAKVSSVI